MKIANIWNQMHHGRRTPLSLKKKKIFRVKCRSSPIVSGSLKICVQYSSTFNYETVCDCHTRFAFNDKYYKHKFGMPMGNCLSPVLSNIYMDFFFFEERIGNAIIPDDDFWVHNVDDTFAILKNTLRLQ